MRFRTGLIIGVGVGYYFGTKAGRERYDQIQDGLQGLLDGDLAAKARAAVDLVLERLRGDSSDLEVDLLVYDETLEP